MFKMGYKLIFILAYLRLLFQFTNHFNCTVQRQNLPLKGDPHLGQVI